MQMSHLVHHSADPPASGIDHTLHSLSYLQEVRSDGYGDAMQVDEHEEEHSSIWTNQHGTGLYHDTSHPRLITSMPYRYQLQDFDSPDSHSWHSWNSVDTEEMSRQMEATSSDSPFGSYYVVPQNPLFHISLESSDTTQYGDPTSTSCPYSDMPWSSISGRSRHASMTPPPTSEPSSAPSSVPSSASSNLPDELYCDELRCTATFSGTYRKGNLARHKRTSHNDPKRYICEDDTCARQFKRQDARLKHYRKRHPNILAATPYTRRRPPSPSRSGGRDADLRNVSGWT
jgi:hypothetical protein